MPPATVPITINGIDVLPQRKGVRGAPRSQRSDIALLPWMLDVVCLVNPPEEAALHPLGLPKRGVGKNRQGWEQMLAGHCLAVARQARCINHADAIVRDLFDGHLKERPKELDVSVRKAAERIFELFHRVPGFSLPEGARESLLQLAGNLVADLGEQWSVARHRAVLLAIAGHAARLHAEPRLGPPDGISQDEWLSAHRGVVVAGEGGRGMRGPEARSERVLAQAIERALRARWPALQQVLAPVRAAAERSRAARDAEL